MANEIARKLVHASGAGIPALYLLNQRFIHSPYLTWESIRYVLAAGVAITVVLEIVRLGFGWNWIVFEKLTREYEQDSVAGYAMYVFSGSLTGIVFEPRIAIPAILMLTLADPISGQLSADELRTIKRPLVLVTMFGVCTLIASIWVPLPAAILGGLAAMVADGVKPIVHGFVVDDNLTIPIYAAVAMTVGLLYLPAVTF
ncbi:dolichol kinase [Halorientalis brevis]|uniref:Dolichol kinase n=1 Tax=Halorientalis brevis TaxID=1126241 RepID=A0ABD6C7Z5_9EURY|nr:dolichol kinase [Halorientalis brevis]